MLNKRKQLLAEEANQSPVASQRYDGWVKPFTEYFEEVQTDKTHDRQQDAAGEPDSVPNYRIPPEYVVPQDRKAAISSIWYSAVTKRWKTSPFAQIPSNPITQLFCSRVAPHDKITAHCRHSNHRTLCTAKETLTRLEATYLSSTGVNSSQPAPT